MKFDLIVANPPYNNDLYIDFITMGHNRIKDTGKSIWIVPAKWQAKGGIANEIFRQNIVPHMKNIVYYIRTADVFDIFAADGISYFLTDTEIHKTKNVSIRGCCEALNCENEQHDYIESWSLKTKSIVDKCSLDERLVDNIDMRVGVYNNPQSNGKEKRENIDDTEIMFQGNVVGYVPRRKLITRDNLDKFKVSHVGMASAEVMRWDGVYVGGSPMIYILKPNQIPRGTFFILKTFDTEDEAKSMQSYLESKLVGFLMAVGACGQSISKQSYRLVPNVREFSRTYSDKYLYELYNLSDEEIQLIEKVIIKRTESQ